MPLANVTGVDVNERALLLANDNARAAGLDSRFVACLPEQVPGNQVFDEIWSNPPIRIGKAALHDLLTTWLPRLRPGGQAHLVVQKNLGADSLAAWLSAQRDDAGAWGHVEKLGSSKGFRVLRLTRAEH